MNKLFCFYLIGCFFISLIVCASAIPAESLFDSDDDMIFESDEGSQFESDTGIEFEDEAFIDDDRVYSEDDVFLEDKNTKKDDHSKHWYDHQILKDSRFTLGYEFSNNLLINPSFVTHDTYIRSEIKTLLTKNLFFQFDGRSNCYFDNDHRTQALNKNIFIDTHLRELFFQTGFGQFNITLGRQIVVWGKADTQIITDIISPRDHSDFIFIKLEDSRIGQLMLSSDMFTRWGNIFFFISPKPLTDKAPEKNTQYDIDIPGMDDVIIIDDKLTYADTEYGIRWKQNLGKMDLSLMAGYFYDNTFIYHFTDFDVVQRKPIINKIYHSYEMVGIAASYISGAYLYKIEAAFKNRLSFQHMNVSNMDIQAIEKDIVDLGVGMEYNANGRYQISAEISNRFIPGNTENLLFTKNNSTSIYTTFTKDFYHETFTFEHMFFYHVQEQNNFHQLRLSHRITDNFQMISSCTFFSMKDKDSLLWFYRNEDRLSVELRYFF